MQSGRRGRKTFRKAPQERRHFLLRKMGSAAKLIISQFINCVCQGKKCLRITPPSIDLHCIIWAASKEPAISLQSHLLCVSAKSGIQQLSCAEHLPRCKSLTYAHDVWAMVESMTRSQGVEKSSFQWAVGSHVPVPQQDHTQGASGRASTSSDREIPSPMFRSWGYHNHAW